MLGFGDLEFQLNSVLAILWLEAVLASLLPWVGPVQPGQARFPSSHIG